MRGGFKNAIIQDDESIGKTKTIIYNVKTREANPLNFYNPKFSPGSRYSFKVFKDKIFKKGSIKQVGTNFNNYIEELSKPSNISFSNRRLRSSNIDKSVIKFAKELDAEKKSIVERCLANIDKSLEIRLNSNKEYIVSIIERVLYAVGFGYDEEKINELDCADLYNLIEAVYDFKNKEFTYVYKSIEEQKLNTQIKKINNKFLVVPSCYSSSNKTLWNFLNKYALSNGVDRFFQLNEIKKIIIMVVYGENAFIEYTENRKKFTMTFEECVNVENENFVGEAGYLNITANNVGVYKKMIIDKIKKNYKLSEITFNQEQEKMFWVRYFNRKIYNRFSKNEYITNDRLKKIGIARHIWNEWISYVAVKYVSLGKAVYHFSMPNVINEKDLKEIKFGVCLPDYEKGISSFDYEYIKANEKLKKDLIVTIIIAKNNFTRAVMSTECLNRKSKEDIMFYDKNEFENKDNLNKNCKRNFLMYFEGTSKNKKLFDEYNESEVFFQIARSIKVIRNTVFHYGSKLYYSDNDIKIVKNLFLQEFNTINENIANKYIENNTLLFYEYGKIFEFIKVIYKQTKLDKDIFPNYKEIINYKTIEYIVKKNIDTDDIKDKGVYNEYMRTLNFILNEYYDYFFVYDEVNKMKLVHLLDYWSCKEYSDLKKKEAVLKLRNDINKILSQDNISFINLYKMISIQNEKVFHEYKYKKNNNKLNEKEYKKRDYIDYYPSLMYTAIKEIFIQDIHNSENVICFLKKPKVNLNNESSLLKQTILEIEIFDNFKKDILKNDEILRWYVISKFISNPKLMRLINDIYSYIYYIRDIETKERIVLKTRNKSNKYDVTYFENVAKLLSICQNFKRNVSLEYSDYFDNVDEYAKYIGNFVDFGQDTSFENLLEFDRFNLYTNNGAPKMNKSIAFSLMYGDGELASQCINKITRKDINRYFTLQNLINTKRIYKTAYNAKYDEDYYKIVKEYNVLKNGIELSKIYRCTDILNDLSSKFISCSYVRERDLMYFQLGVHYLRLYFNDNALDIKYNTLKNEKISINEGALLYQITAMYTYSLPVYKLVNGAAVRMPGNETSTSVLNFCRGYCNENGEFPITYFCCLELFENISKHDEYTTLRNAIAHEKYVSNNSKSYIEIINEIYKGFLNYDIKLKKGFLDSIKNILHKNCLDVDYKFTLDKKSGDTFIKFYYSDLAFVPKIKHSDLELDAFSVKYENIGYDKKFANELLKMVEYKR